MCTATGGERVMGGGKCKGRGRVGMTIEDMMEGAGWSECIFDPDCT
jgi:hypothetical protein